MLDADGLAALIYRAAGTEPWEPENPVHLARNLFGPDAVRVLPTRLMPFSRAMLVPIKKSHRIFVRADVPAREMAHHVAHELGHWILARSPFRVDPATLELAADAIGAAVVAPRTAFLRAFALFGPDLHDHGVRAAYADAFATTETLVTLRFGELSRQPVAVVHDGPHAPIVRATPRDAWPASGTIMRWAGVPPTGIVKARIRDEPRWALFRGPGVVGLVA